MDSRALIPIVASALPTTLVAELERHRDTYAGDALPEGYVFTTPTGQPLKRSNFRQRI